ncbi:CBD9-like protein [Coprinopsis marcescibilis]|uniref:CBD9-like protein n=1 Tax=Coprinopsis marcescibilis TaxID=230819 RepID=A0A5C3L0Z1_COPMA|nr:CBD9-like protein [Coprinopsis marcescibilis]
MRLLGPLALAILSATSAVATGSLIARAPPGGGYGGYGGSSSDDTASGGSRNPPTGGSPNNGTSASALGDERCNTNMCINAQVNGNTVRYTLTSQRDQVGWMAMGFGRTMVGSPMIIMWANGDGTVTLSQRQATRQAEPAVVDDPPRIATLQQTLSVTSGNRHSYVFDLPANSDTTQNIIWAYSGTRPSSSAEDARLVQHTAQGTTTLDLTRTVGGGEDRDDAESVTLTSGQRTFLAHAVIASIAFLIIMPIGGLIPRYLRTFTTGWFKFHWFIQFVLAGVLAVIGIVLAIVGISNAGGSHLNSPHKRGGIILLVLYFLQVSLGAIIHFVKPKRGGRPPQNYVHAILGITIVALSLYQVRTGYNVEWPELVGRPAPNAVNIVWYVWVVLLPVAYFGGLALLPRQWKQEKKSREATSDIHGVEKTQLLRR